MFCTAWDTLNSLGHSIQPGTLCTARDTLYSPGHSVLPGILCTAWETRQLQSDTLHRLSMGIQTSQHALLEAIGEFIANKQSSGNPSHSLHIFLPQPAESILHSSVMKHKAVYWTSNSRNTYPMISYSVEPYYWHFQTLFRIPLNLSTTIPSFHFLDFCSFPEHSDCSILIQHRTPDNSHLGI